MCCSRTVALKPDVLPSKNDSRTLFDFFSLKQTPADVLLIVLVEQQPLPLRGSKMFSHVNICLEPYFHKHEICLSQNFASCTSAALAVAESWRMTAFWLSLSVVERTPPFTLATTPYNYYYSLFSSSRRKEWLTSRRRQRYNKIYY